jgi:DNA-binding NarL/FixJ family response regulator
MKIKILLVDDHQVVREGLRRLLADETDMEVVGEAAYGNSAHALAVRLAPHVVVMDVSMPGLNGINATRSLRQLSPPPLVVILSMHADTRYVTESLQAGATGYVLKDAAFDELARAIRAVHAQGVYLSPGIARAVTENLGATPSRRAAANLAALTPREREVLQLLANGQSTKQLALALGISVKTVETHRRRIMERLSLHSLAALTKFAIREGLTTAEA